MTETNIENKPKVVIDMLKYRIRIHRTTLNGLGQPQKVLFMVHPTGKSFVVKVTTPNDKKGHTINYEAMNKGHSCEVYSQLLIKEIGKLFPNWKTGEKYILNGAIIEKENLAVFDMTSAIPLTTKGDF